MEPENLPPPPGRRGGSEWPTIRTSRETTKEGSGNKELRLNDDQDSRDPLEIAACTPVPVDDKGFNLKADLPYGLTTDHVRAAMREFVDFLGFNNGQMHGRDLPRFESMLMPANFSSIVGEFMSSTIPKHCPTIVKNNYHNGHPDMIPKGVYPDDSAQHEDQGIELKGSRYVRGWQEPGNARARVYAITDRGRRLVTDCHYRDGRMRLDRA